MQELFEKLTTASPEGTNWIEVVRSGKLSILPATMTCQPRQAVA